MIPLRHVFCGSSSRNGKLPCSRLYPLARGRGDFSGIHVPGALRVEDLHGEKRAAVRAEHLQHGPVERYRQVVQILFRHGFGYLVDQLGLGHLVPFHWGCLVTLGGPDLSNRRIHRGNSAAAANLSRNRSRTSSKLAPGSRVFCGRSVGWMADLCHLAEGPPLNERGV